MQTLITITILEAIIIVLLSIHSFRLRKKSKRNMEQYEKDKIETDLLIRQLLRHD